jgi:hypothetical protein
MSKRKRGRTVKAQASSKVRPRAGRTGEHTRRANSKQARVLGLLRRPGGATIATISALLAGIVPGTNESANEARPHFGETIRKHCCRLF